MAGNPLSDSAGHGCKFSGATAVATVAVDCHSERGDQPVAKSVPGCGDTIANRRGLSQPGGRVPPMIGAPAYQAGNVVAATIVEVESLGALQPTVIELSGQSLPDSIGEKFPDGF